MNLISIYSIEYSGTPIGNKGHRWGLENIALVERWPLAKGVFNTLVYGLWNGALIKAVVAL